MKKVIKDTMEFDKEIQVISGWLSRGDKFLAEELRSEMHIAIMNMEEGKPRSFYLRVAKCRAIDYLRSRSRHYSYGGVIKHVSLQAIRTAGYQIDTDGNVYLPDMDNSASIGDSDDL
ncbi:hypothetical protein ACFL6S_22525 [Candidatus Poribacteria bacterium]